MSKAVKNPLSQLTEIQEKKSQQKKKAAEESQSGWIRKTMHIRESHDEMLNRVAFWTKKPQKMILDQIIKEYLADREIPPIPKMDKNQTIKLIGKKQPKDS